LYRSHALPVASPTSNASSATTSPNGEIIRS
jgi:hypothetical protein